MLAKNKTLPEETTFGDEVLRGLNDFLKSVEKGEPLTNREVTLEAELLEDGAQRVRTTRRKRRS